MLPTRKEYGGYYELLYATDPRLCSEFFVPLTVPWNRGWCHYVMKISDGSLSPTLGIDARQYQWVSVKMNIWRCKLAEVLGFKGDSLDKVYLL